MTTLATTLGYILAVFLGILELLILYFIWNGTIDLRKLISEKNGDASLSRFQFMVFTFVIAMSFFLVVAAEPTSLPDVPPGVFALLGISGGSYVVSKGIQARMEREGGEPGDGRPSGAGGAGGGRPEGAGGSGPGG